MPGGHHMSPREIEREAACRVEFGVPIRRYMLDTLHIVRPPRFLRVLSAGDTEPPVGPLSCGFQQQPIQHRLTIGTVGSEIAQVPAQRNSAWSIDSWIHRAEQR